MHPRASSSPSAAAGSTTGAGPATIQLTVEQLVLAASLYWALSANRAFFSAALGQQPVSDPATWRAGVSIFLLVVALHVLLLALLASRRTVKPLLALLLPLTAGAAYFTDAYGVHLDPAMLRNVLQTNAAEAGELLTGSLALHLALFAGVPLVLLWRVRIVQRPWLRAAVARLLTLMLAAAAVAAALLWAFQPLAALLRNHREVRYLVTPANYLWSLGAVLAAEVRGAAGPRHAIGLDASPGPSWEGRHRPLVVLLVVGETARAANWGLSGYARQTTPQLAGLDVTNFPYAVACGTDTETSLPCMFAPVGRRAYDAARIRGAESLLHVLARAGVAVHWRDNQSGCKGVCEGLPAEVVKPASRAPGPCAEGRCLDGVLTDDLAERLASAQGTQLWVLHMLGNHGPSYFRRYPPAFARFQPECRDDDLRRCSVEQVVNAYDNALLYTDHLLAQAIRTLKAHSVAVDSALIYVSDHGESLGEHGLFLHGMPYAIAPDVQTRVPLVMWASDGFERAAGLAPGCLRPYLQRRAAQPASHDHLFHTLLGLLDVRTRLYDPQWDLVRACRSPAAGGG